jgi:hypothetical protein
LRSNFSAAAAVANRRARCTPSCNHRTLYGSPARLPVFSTLMSLSVVV